MTETQSVIYHRKALTFLRQEYAKHWKRKELSEHGIESKVVAAVKDGDDLVVVWEADRKYLAQVVEDYQKLTLYEIFLAWIKQVPISWFLRD